MKFQNIQMGRRAATVKKTYNLPAELIARAKRILHAKTETETIVRSLERVAVEEEIWRAIRRVAGTLPRFRPLR